MTSTQVWQAAGYGQQEGMIGIVVWKAAMCGRHTGYGKQEGMIRQCGMEGNKVWQDHKQRVMECTMVWQAQIYGGQ